MTLSWVGWEPVGLRFFAQCHDLLVGAERRPREASQGYMPVKEVQLFPERKGFPSEFSVVVDEVGYPELDTKPTRGENWHQFHQHQTIHANQCQVVRITNVNEVISEDAPGDVAESEKGRMPGW